ncbi:MAG: zinc transporter [Myxococcota bacterium]|jgi:zinc transporter
MSTDRLVSFLTLDGAGGGRVSTDEEVAADPASAPLLWVHVDFGQEAGRRWLEEHSGLSEILIEALLADEPRPRSLVMGDGLLVILRGVNLNAGSDPEDMVSLRMWLEAGRIITVRRRRLAAIGDIRDQLAQGAGPTDAGDFLQEIVDRLLDRIGETVGALDDRADELEDAVLSMESRELRPKLGALRRQAIALRRYIAPQRDAIARLQSEKASWLVDIHRARLREDADRITRYVEDLDSARDRVAVTQEELSNRLSEEMNRTMYLLSVVAAIFLPLGLLTGLLGINVGGIPGTESPYAFMLVSISLVVMAGALAAWFRSKRIV